MISKNANADNVRKFRQKFSDLFDLGVVTVGDKGNADLDLRPAFVELFQIFQNETVRNAGAARMDFLVKCFDIVQKTVGIRFHRKKAFERDKTACIDGGTEVFLLAPFQ